MFQWCQNAFHLFEFCICFNSLVCGVSCATANQHSRFNQLTSHSVRLIPALMHHFVMRRLRFQSFQVTMPMQKASSELPGDKFHQNTVHQTFWERYIYIYILCIVWPVQSTQHVKCSACFLGLFCHPWWNVWRQMMRQLEAAHQQRTSSRKYTEGFPFYGLWDTIFIAFGLNLSGDAFHKFHCSVQHHSSAVDHARQLFWRMFLGNCEGRLYILHTQNQIATH